MRFTGTSKNDRLTGTITDDVFVASSGSDVLDGWYGSDTVDYGSWGGRVVVVLGPDGRAGSAQKYLQTSTRWVSAGTDTLYSIENVIGSQLDDAITGNELDNTLAGLGGGDVLNGGGGTDTVDYSAATSGVTVDLYGGHGYGGHAQGDSYQSIENAIGSVYDDWLIGTSGANRLVGSGGRDHLEGYGGADWLDGGEGIDTASYLASATGVIVNLATSLNVGGDAAGDVLVGIENLEGSNRSDRLTGDSRINELHGQDGADVLAGLGGADLLEGNAGEDTADYHLSAAPVIVNLKAHSGSGGDAEGDSLYSIENVIGTLYGDRLTGDDDINTLEGADGNDVLVGLGEGDHFLGGSGSDTVDYTDSPGRNFLEGISVNLTTGAALYGHASGDTFDSIENVTGSTRSDFLTGNGEANILDGGQGYGNDVLRGLGGADTLIGGEGIADMADYADSPRAVTVNLRTNVNLRGDAEGDLLYGIEDVQGSAYGDNLTGDAQDNDLFGGGDADILCGGDGNDFLNGEAGQDQLVGGRGRDTLWGATGGSDNQTDTFIYNTVEDSPFGTSDSKGVVSPNYDTIFNLEVGIDRLDLRGIDANVLSSGDQAFRVVEQLSGRAGELVIGAMLSAGDGLYETMLYADVTGDGSADFAIRLFGIPAPGISVQISAGDILL